MRLLACTDSGALTAIRAASARAASRTEPSLTTWLIRPHSKASDALIGSPVNASDAFEWGLINQVVNEGSVLDAALALAARITVNAPLSVQASKRIAYGVDGGVITADEPGWDRTLREMRSLIRSEDAREGPLAFAEKREPVWKAR